MSLNKSRVLVIFVAITVTFHAVAQTVNDSVPINRKELRIVITVGGTAAVTSITGLSFLWYADYTHSSFHFINDNGEWLQMDKAGHLTASYHIGRFCYELLRIPSLEEKKAIWYGGSLGFVYLSIVEILDGFSSGWGASVGDLAADAAGSAVFIGQQLAWREQRLLFKWSYHPTVYAGFNPSQLGRNLPEKMIKDYNGQTFWISANINSFLGKTTRFPGWINIAAGYSADGMIGPRYNPVEIDGITIPSFKRTRQFFLSPDIDFTRIRTDSHLLKTLFSVLSVFKLPFPTLEFNTREQLVFHPFCF